MKAGRSSFGVEGCIGLCEGNGGMGIMFGGCDWGGESWAELKLSYVSGLTDCRLNPLFLGGNRGKGGGLGGIGGAVIGGAIEISCGEVSGWGGSVSSVLDVAVWNVL